MTHAYADVNQLNPEIAGDGKQRGFRLDRYGELVVATREGLVDAWTREGRVFIGANPVIGQPETMSSTAGTAVTLTDPSIRFTVPSGLVVVPISVTVSAHHTTAKHAVFSVIATGSDSYTSGGDAVPATVYNALVNSTTVQRPTAVTKFHYSDTALVEAALVGPRLLKTYFKNATATDPTDWVPEYNIMKGDPMVYIKGPGSFLVWAVEETAAVEAEFTLMWAELESSTVP